MSSLPTLMMLLAFLASCTWAAQSPVPLITHDGRWAGTAVEQHLKATGFSGRGTAYGVVAVIGPQSSGKSTLLNALYGSQFDEMSAADGRTRTTRGVWAQCPSAQPHLLLLQARRDHNHHPPKKQHHHKPLLWPQPH